MTDGVLAGRRIFIVEDEATIAMLLEDMLDDLGCCVAATAARPAQALAAIDAAQPIDAAILDLNLDGQRSYDVADALAARGVPFVFATGYGPTGLIEGYRDRPVLRKPFSFKELARALSDLLSP